MVRHAEGVVNAAFLSVLLATRVLVGLGIFKKILKITSYRFSYCDDIWIDGRQRSEFWDMRRVAWC